MNDLWSGVSNSWDIQSVMELKRWKREKETVKYYLYFEIPVKVVKIVPRVDVIICWVNKWDGMTMPTKVAQLLPNVTIVVVAET